VIEDAPSGHLPEVAPLDSPVDRTWDDRASGVEHAIPERSNVPGRVRALVHAHFDLVWRTLRRFGVPAADADDGAQRVFIIASQKLEQIEPGRDRAFLVGTAYRVASEMRRAGSRRGESSIGETEFVDPAPGPEEYADRKRARALLDQVLDEMPFEMRSVFVLFELEELTVPQIALTLTLPIGTVSSRLRRARGLFRESAERIRARAAFPGGSR
jgi:RNA polymerase sigma-70 factor, ECF subfamily